MSSQLQAGGPAFSTSQQLLYVVVGFVIWVMGVIIVRVLGPAFFTPGSWLLVLLFGASIPFGILLQYIVPPLIKVPMKDSLMPIYIMVTTAIICDGVAIAFTNVYSADPTIKMAVGGWLLWTFGWQMLVSLLIINRANGA